MLIRKQKLLMERLQQELSCLVKLLEKQEREELRKKRLKFVAINMDNILKQPKTEAIKPERKDRKYSKSEDENSARGSEYSESESDDYDYLQLRSTRTCKKISYQFKEYDDLINSAIQNEDYEEEGYTYSKGKDMQTIINSERSLENEDIKNDVQPESEKSEEELEDGKMPPIISARKVQTKKRRLNDLDSPPEDDSDESFQGMSDTEVEDENTEEEAVSDEASEESEDSFTREQRFRSRKVVRGSKKSRKREYARDGFVVYSDESESSIRIKRNIPLSRSSSRRRAAKKVSYKEETSESEEDWEEQERKRKIHQSESDDWESDEKSKKKSKKYEMGEEGEEEDDEDEEEEEDEEEDESDDSEKQPVSKPEKLVMRGKPRLSKAALTSLREKSESSKEEEKNNGTKQQSTTKLKGVNNSKESVIDQNKESLSDGQSALSQLTAFASREPDAGMAGTPHQASPLLQSSLEGNSYPITMGSVSNSGQKNYPPPGPTMSQAHYHNPSMPPNDYPGQEFNRPDLMPSQNSRNFYNQAMLRNHGPRPPAPPAPESQPPASFHQSQFQHPPPSTTSQVGFVQQQQHQQQQNINSGYYSSDPSIPHDSPNVNIPSRQSPIYPPPPPGAYPPPSQGMVRGEYAYYSATPGMSPNGFLIQNLLQQRANNPLSVANTIPPCPPDTAPGSLPNPCLNPSPSEVRNLSQPENMNMEQNELRSVADIVSFMTQE